jgi:hypothetical protein
MLKKSTSDPKSIEYTGKIRLEKTRMTSCSRTRLANFDWQDGTISGRGGSRKRETASSSWGRLHRGSPAAQPSSNACPHLRDGVGALNHAGLTFSIQLHHPVRDEGEQADRDLEWRRRLRGELGKSAWKQVGRAL